MNSKNNPSRYDMVSYATDPTEEQHSAHKLIVHHTSECKESYLSSAKYWRTETI